MAKKQLTGVDNFCYKVLDTSTNQGCNGPKYQKKKKENTFSKHIRRNQNRNWKFKKSSNFRKDKKFPLRKFFKKKSSYEKPEKKSCICWLCKAEGHYANECPTKEKRTSKALLEEYEDIIKTVNTKGYEVVYSEDEDSKSVYPAYTEEESSSDSDMSSEE